MTGKELKSTTADSVVLRGVAVELDSAIGGAFITDCARNTEGVISDAELRAKYDLSEDQWNELATNEPLLRMVRAEHERRIYSGAAAREAAQVHFAKAPHRLGHMVQDNMESSRNRIEATKELGKIAAGTGPETMSGDKVIINIVLSRPDEPPNKITIEARPPLSLPEGE